MSYKRMIVHYLISIIYTSLFLITTTIYWYYNIKDRYSLTYNDLYNDILTIQVSDLEKVNNQNINNIKSYKINLKNEEDHEYKIFLINNNYNSTLTNNYIKYQINDLPVNSLNMDGLLYLNYLTKDKEEEINLKIWISDTYDGKTNYQGSIIVI